jgi:3-hydroxyacyl-[acyl-carrier-protein] dehydratase
MSEATSRLQTRAPLEHASYAGHFPGAPVVPGVVLLEFVTRAIARGAPCAITAAKFHRALTPGDEFEIEWTSRDTATTFRCRRAGQLVAEGALRYPA